ncbi:hypothetical protein E2562_037983 [Oryza meyeriana var. granulata]|uniref:Secreted protein n=1 Tax=Oryza meyeriana var. granulata TaxID=110450 RepID=A0A6G1E985_9ORYZ|nr:hypothetical protein E2562_037983 [Oryza meyeriana var. granulata]
MFGYVTALIRCSLLCATLAPAQPGVPPQPCRRWTPTRLHPRHCLPNKYQATAIMRHPLAFVPLLVLPPRLKLLPPPLYNPSHADALLPVCTTQANHHHPPAPLTPPPAFVAVASTARRNLG